MSQSHVRKHSWRNDLNQIATSETESSRQRTPNAGMFDLARIEFPKPGWFMAIGPAVVAWLGSVSFLGVFRANDVTDTMGHFCSLRSIFLGVLAVSLVLTLLYAMRRNFAYCVLWFTIAGYLGGHELYAWLPVHGVKVWRIPFQEVSHGFYFASHRMIYGFCVAGMALLCLWISSALRGQRPSLYLRFGNWRALGRDFTHRSKPETYIQSILGFLAFAVVLAIVVQMSVGLKPLRSGSLFPLIPALVIAAIANAFAEELIYRGVLQSAFVHAAGLARGIWICSLMFGLLHWGLSVGLLTALPTSFLIGVGSVFWGKSLRDTGGISWAIAAHSMVDFAVMCAYFVPIH